MNSENSITFYAIVVLYNENGDNSRSLNNLKKIINYNIKIVVVDNSSKDMKNEEFCRVHDYYYIPMGGNKGLSKAYNHTLSKLNVSGNDKIIIWFDDDTDITQEYFDKLYEAVVKYPEIDIFAPVIYGQDGKIYSPNQVRYFRNKQLKKPSGYILEKKFNAINSCTAVRAEVYDGYRYDERMFLDQIDHRFFEDQRMLNRRFMKLDTIINHNFSLKGENRNPEIAWRRYEIMIPDFMIYCERTTVRKLLGICKVLGWAIRGGIQYHSLKFSYRCMKKCFQNIG